MSLLPNGYALRKGGDGRLTDSDILKVRKVLMTDLGISPRMSNIITSRYASEIMKIEQSVHCVIDCLLFYDRELFMRGADFGLLKNIVKKTILTSTFRVSTTTKLWKNFTSILYNVIVQNQTLQDIVQVKGNYFFSLWYPLRIDRLAEGVLKEDLTPISHLVSTRHFPCGDKKDEEKSLHEFKEIVTSNIEIERNHLAAVYHSAQRFGEFARSIGAAREQMPHISLAGAASYYCSIKDGGRATEIIDSIKPRLKFTPLIEKEIVTPFGTVRDVPGIARWNTWTKSPIPDSDPFDSLCDEGPHPAECWGEQIPWWDLMGEEVYRFGFDDRIGFQIQICAWLDYVESDREAAIPVRTCTIPEPGGKSRIVSTGPYWLYVLQQAIGGIMRNFLASLPSAEAGMVRADQAWRYMYQLSPKVNSMKPDFYVLSSDLKSASDAIPKSCALHVMAGFLSGIHIENGLTDLMLELLARPRGIYSDIGYFESSRGVFMGEALTKPILTLINMVSEEIALREYLNMREPKYTVLFNDSLSLYRYSYTPSKTPKVDWRCFACAGDDHIAVGPEKYLSLITENLVRTGMVISQEKHGMSRIAVRYCEKFLYVPNMSNAWNVHAINDSVEGAYISPFVDSIKLRLISPCSKSNEVFNDRNTAIGKGISLGNTLAWLPDGMFSKKHMSLFRDRFFQRMNALLPPRTSGVYWHLLLPASLGGMGLATEVDYVDLVERLPDPTKVVIRRIVDDPSYRGEDLEMMRSFLTPASFRGFEIDNDRNIAKRLLREMMEQCPGKTLEALIEELNISTTDPIKQIRLLKAAGWYREDYFLERLTRPFLFNDILCGKQKVKPFLENNLKKRYAKFWSRYYCGTANICVDDIRQAFKWKREYLFYSGGYLIDDALYGMPTLSLEWGEFGEPW
nr:MAG: RNA-dependent RNA polymerase [Ips narna-like virus 1]